MYSEILSVIEKLVTHPLYHLAGISMNRLIYISTLEGSTDLWSSKLDGGEAIKLVERLVSLSKPRHEDDKILYTLDVSKGREMHKIYIVDSYGKESYEAFEMIPVRIFGLAHYDDLIAYSGSSVNENILYISRLNDKAEKIYSTDKWLFVTDMDESYVIGAGTLAGNPRSMEIFIYSVKENEFKIYTPKEGSFNEPSMIYNNRILFSSNYDGEKKLYVYNIEDEELRKPLFEGDEYKRFRFNDYQNYGFTDDDRIWFIGLYGYRGYAFLDGYRIYHPEGTPENIEVYKNNIYISFSSLKTPNSIYKTTFDKNGWRRIIGRDLDKEIMEKLGEIWIIKYKSFDNLEIPTIIYESKNNDKPGPTVLYIHGGPWSHIGDLWSIFMASLVASGFHVIAPNFRGSTGYGEEFRRLDIGDPGGDDLKDIIYAREYAFNIGLANKIAIMGYSYGGFMTYLATVKKPDIWDAGVAGAGIVDWKTMYELADAAFKHFQEILFAGDKDLWRDRSAINYPENLKTPLCILHPQNDTRTPLKPVLKYMEELIKHGKTFEAHVFPDMGHMVTRLEDALKLLYPAVIFLSRTLKR